MSKYLFLLVLTLVSCGGGSSGVPEQPSPSYTISGKAYIGNVNSSTISLYSYSKAKRGALITSTTTDDTGLYQLTTNDLSKDLLVCLSEGRFTDPFTSITSDITDELCATISNSRTDAIVAITYYSHIAYGLSQYRSKMGILPANKTISAWIGFDVIQTLPADVTLKTGSSALTEAYRAGFANAAISVLANTLKVTPLEIAVKAYYDVQFDGLLNGTDEYGTNLLTTKMYRHDAALDILIFANNSANGSNVTSTMLVDTATQYNTNKSFIFADEAIVSFSLDMPNIENVSILDNDILGGDKLLKADIVDLIGVSNVSMVISHPTYTKSVGTLKNAGTITAPASTIKTTSFTEGLNYTITITATNVLNSVKVLIIKNLAISNTGTSFNRIQPQSPYLNKTKTLSVEVFDPVGILNVALKDNGQTRQPASQGAGLYSFLIDTTLLTEGSNVFTLEATNSVEAVTTKALVYIVDNVPPVLTFDSIPPYWIAINYGLGGTVTDLNIKSATLATGEFTSSKIINDRVNLDVVITKATPQGPRTIVFEAQDLAGNITTITESVVIDYTPPVMNISKQAGRTGPTSCFLDYSASDTGGSNLGAGIIGKVTINPVTNGKHTVEFKNLLFYQSTAYSIDYYIEDRSGNRSATQSAKFYIDCPPNARNCTCGIR